jgi:hypothetical protein
MDKPVNPAAGIVPNYDMIKDQFPARPDLPEDFWKEDGPIFKECE